MSNTNQIENNIKKPKIKQGIKVFIRLWSKEL